MARIVAEMTAGELKRLVGLAVEENLSSCWVTRTKVWCFGRVCAKGFCGRSEPWPRGNAENSWKTSYAV